MSRYPPVAKFDNPIAGKDTAETFGETDVTVTHSDTQVSGESVELAPKSEQYADSASTTYRTESWSKILFTPNDSVSSMDCHAMLDGSGFDSLEVVRESDLVVVSNTVTFTAGDTVTITPNNPLKPGTQYSLKVYASDGTDHTAYYTNNMPTGDMVVTEGYDTASGVSGSNDWIVIDDVTFNGDAMSGSSYVEWPYPNDIYRWDAATFQKSEGNETVDIYIEESSDGGSTWTEIAGPIGRGRDITANPSNECRFRVDISRASVANNPTLDSIYRRWVV